MLSLLGYVRPRGNDQPSRANAKRTVLVFTVGKVGSLSIYETCARDESIDAYHLHHLTPRALVAQRSAFQGDPDAMYDYLKTAIRVSESGVLRQAGLKVINLVRDPVSRSLSHFFESTFPDNSSRTTALLERIKGGDEQACLREVFQEFLRTRRHHEPFDWTATELAYLLKASPYRYGFDRERGYGLATMRNLSVLTLQCELPEERKVRLLNSFLGTSFGNLVPSNVTGARQIGPFYRRFLSFARFDDEFLNSMYRTKYCRHYYTRAQLADFRERWEVRGSTAPYWQLIADTKTQDTILDRVRQLAELCGLGPDRYVAWARIPEGKQAEWRLELRERYPTDAAEHDRFMVMVEAIGIVYELEAAIVGRPHRILNALDNAIAAVTAPRSVG